MDKQSYIHVFGAGWVNRLDLTHDKDRDAIKGRVSIRISDKEVITFEVYEPHFFGDGENRKENFRFKAYQTIMKEYKDATQVDKWDLATKIYIGLNRRTPRFPNATIEISTYVSRMGEIQNRMRNRLYLMNRSENEEKFTPEMNFKVENFIVDSVSEEINQQTGTMTGRGIVFGYVIDYQGIARPINFVITEEGYKYAKDNWVQNSVVDISGQVRNIAVPVENHNNMGFGTMRGEPSYEYIKEYLITAGSPPQSDRFTREEIEEAMLNYQKLTNELLIAANQTDMSPSMEDEDIPF